MVKALIGRKREMSQIFTDAGEVVPVTIVEAGPCAVTQVKTAGSKDGYNAYQLAFDDKPKNVSKPLRGHYQKAGVPSKRVAREYHFEGEPQHKVGDIITVQTFAAGDMVDVTGTTKGRGFQGGVKRHGFTQHMQSHGRKMIRHGSVGTNTTPARVLKGKRMSGHLGTERVTTRNLEVVLIDAERNLLYIKGAIPGHPNADVFVREAISGSRRKGPKGKK
ncbi:MAG: 50S ribosomal protein L3 [Planctomycetes bacterium]|nr:50S ribosomal protein L3 [Planctomycetota bacterium]NUQ35608.1 50S ribosomal protein L3 [Planctomycetaceae bacterium]